MSTAKRVQILDAGSNTPYFKRGQYAYVVGENRLPTGNRYECYPQRGGGTTAPCYLVSKTKEMRGGALWFTADAVRFTGRR